ncbi:MAG: hypothetical protein J7L15_03065 [Clostridiales bacterium]|nr:hypothetical protein [Clostridiales bacterium]
MTDELSILDKIDSEEIFDEQWFENVRLLGRVLWVKGSYKTAKKIFEEIEKLIEKYLVGDEFDPADVYNFAVDFVKLKEKYLGDDKNGI